MKGQFEFTQELLDNGNLTEMEIVRLMLDQQLRKAGVSEKERLTTGWHARRVNPQSGNKQYLWDTNITSKLFNSKYEGYFRLLKMEGWELAYDLGL